MFVHECERFRPTRYRMTGKNTVLFSHNVYCTYPLKWMWTKEYYFWGREEHFPMFYLLSAQVASSCMSLLWYLSILHWSYFPSSTSIFKYPLKSSLKCQKRLFLSHFLPFCFYHYFSSLQHFKGFYLIISWDIWLFVLGYFTPPVLHVGMTETSPMEREER